MKIVQFAFSALLIGCVIYLRIQLQPKVPAFESPGDWIIAIVMVAWAIAVVIAEFSFFFGGGTTQGSFPLVVQRYGHGWEMDRHLTRGICLGLGGLSGIAQDMLGDETQGLGGKMVTKTWTINDVLLRLGLKAIPQGGMELITIAIEKLAPDSGHVDWTTKAALLDATSADLFAKAIADQTRSWKKRRDPACLC